MAGWGSLEDSLYLIEAPKKTLKLKTVNKLQKWKGKRGGENQEARPPALAAIPNKKEACKKKEPLLAFWGGKKKHPHHTLSAMTEGTLLKKEKLTISAR